MCGTAARLSTTRLTGQLLTVLCSHGVQGTLDRASKAQIENEFGTKNEDDAVKALLEKGTVQETKGEAKQGGRNESNGPGIANNTQVHN